MITILFYFFTFMLTLKIIENYFSIQTYKLHFLLFFHLQTIYNIQFNTYHLKNISHDNLCRNINTSDQ